MDNRIVALKLYGPLLVVFVVLLVFARTLGMESYVLGTIKPSVGIFSLSVPITNALAARVVLVLMGVWSLSAYLFYDYAKFFPSDLKYEVNFETDFIYKALALIPTESSTGLQIPDDAETQRQTWMKYIDDQLSASIPGSEPFLTSHGGKIHGSGTAEFRMEKISGLQRYYIKVSNGRLTTKLTRPGYPPRTINSKFDKIDTVYDTVSLSVRDFFVRRGTILRTLYEQSLQTHSNEITLKSFNVVALTPVTIFPWPRIGKTVYLGTHDGTTVIPFGFAEYK